MLREGNNFSYVLSLLAIVVSTPYKLQVKRGSNQDFAEIGGRSELKKCSEYPTSVLNMSGLLNEVLMCYFVLLQGSGKQFKSVGAVGLIS